MLTGQVIKVSGGHALWRYRLGESIGK
jgi:hypothetical protein